MWEKLRGKSPRPAVEAAARALELPASVAGSLPEIELLGNREAVVEHCQGVLEYNDQVVRLNTGRLVVKFAGRNLRLRCMSADSVTVEGHFTSIEFS